MIKINAKGKVCPIPLIESKKVLNGIEKDETVIVTVDNEIAKENLEKMAKEMGYKCNTKTIAEDHYEVIIVKGLGLDGPVESIYNNEKNESIVVVISSDKMGQGNDELGGVLIKGFIYALTEIEKLPRSIIFYNGGAKLSIKESPVIEDLRKLEEMGVEILTCGTCLNYYNLKDKLAVGKVTNMYSIVEKMNESDKIIKP